jgi:poly-gamma-glutamate synthesis protein (capsule biosynthesis protein)
MLAVRGRHHTRRIWVIILVFILLCIIGIAVWLYTNKDQSSTKTETNKHSNETVKVPQPVSIYSNTLFMGNIFWGRYMNDWSMASPLKTAYPFSRLNEFHRDQYNAWITGLECPTKTGVNMTSAEMEVALQFNCSPDYLPEAAKWFTAFTLANNHTDNQGIDGFAQTQKQLDKNGIQYFGHYDPRELNDICDVISLPVTVTNDDDSTSKGKLPIALCGYHGVFRIPPAESVAVMEQYSKLMPVIAMPHMGVEYQPAPDQLKTSFYRSLIDGGADMVLGDHPHWIQNTESYKGHLIVYSMGNFMFDQQGVTEVERSAAIEVVIKTGGDDKALIKKWLALGEKCSAYHDTCLADAVKQGLTKLDISFQFGVVGTSDANKITKPATAAEQAGILQRLQWQSTMNQLQAPYSKL